MSFTRTWSAATGSTGAVYIIDNAATGNNVWVYARAADGSLTSLGSVSTKGLGTGACRGSGRPCTYCQQPIRVGEAEYEVAAQDGSPGSRDEASALRFHLGCHDAWRTAHADYRHRRTRPVPELTGTPAALGQTLKTPRPPLHQGQRTLLLRERRSRKVARRLEECGIEAARQLPTSTPSAQVNH